MNRFVFGFLIWEQYQKNKKTERELTSYSFQNNNFWASLVVQWLRFHASNAGGMGLIPDWELRSHRLCGAAKTNQTPYNNF